MNLFSPFRYPEIILAGTGTPRELRPSANQSALGRAMGEHPDSLAKPKTLSAGEAIAGAENLPRRTKRSLPNR